VTGRNRTVTGLTHAYKVCGSRRPTLGRWVRGDGRVVESGSVVGTGGRARQPPAGPFPDRWRGVGWPRRSAPERSGERCGIEAASPRAQSGSDQAPRVSKNVRRLDQPEKRGVAIANLNRLMLDERYYAMSRPPWSA
jgi:hypothetical protein